jgi:hypothetical protein
MYDTSLWLGGKEFKSRLIVGTGKYPSFENMREAIEASGSEIVTVAVRRVSLPGQGESLLDYVDPKKYVLLPNTAGCYSADEASAPATWPGKPVWARWSSSRSSATRGRSSPTCWVCSKPPAPSRARVSPCCPTRTTIR